MVVLGQRIEGYVLDESETGLGVALPPNCGLTVKQSVRLVYKRQQLMGKVARVEDSEEFDRVGIKLVG